MLTIVYDEPKQLEKGIKAFQNENFLDAYNLILPWAVSGYAKAQCYIATMYQCGLGVSINGVQAVKWYRKAAEQGEKYERISATAYNNLGTIFSVGMPGIQANIGMAKKYWRKAVELGFEMIPNNWYEDSQPRHTEQHNQYSHTPS